MKIIADPNIPLVQEAFGPLGEVRLVPGREITADAVRDADALLVRSVTPVNAALLDGSRVRFVATATIGFDHIDREYLSQKGIGFASAQGSNANSVAEYVTAAMLELAHRQKFRLRDKTLGVIGVGNVGSRVVRYAEALGMRVLQNDPPRQRTERLAQFVSLERVLAEADIVTLHVPLARAGADATFHLFDKDRLGAVERRKPILINSSRGAVMDNPALLKAVDGEHLGGVVLDVWENEPNISPELLDVVDLATPHIAGYSFDGKVNGTRMIYEAVCGFFHLPPTWSPHLPPPPVPRIELAVSSGEDEEEVLRRVIRRVYDINGDDSALRGNVRAFDKLRAEYPVRREFFNTELVLRGASKELRATFAALGFKTG
ncbi:MAG: 4-phosphoerythronate dehydrogenase PdxB [Verrucomicrobiia bacterium]|jgi:erythronate-4-phosphate dehydrogenase